MPKYRPETAKQKAKNLAKSLIQNGMSQSKVARKEGVTPQAINQRVHNKAVKETMAEILDKIGVTDDYLGGKLKEGCEASEVIVKGRGKKTKAIEVPDHKTRHRYVVTSLEVKKHIRADEDAKPMKLVIEYGHRRPKEGDPAK